MIHRVFIVLTSTLLCWGCAPRPEPGPGPPAAEPSAATGRAVQQFIGIYEAGWELEVFRPCGMAEEWWSWSTTRIVRDDPRGWGRLLVVVEGDVSERGRYGHLGRYPRQIVITRLVEVLGDADAACPPTRDVTRAGGFVDRVSGPMSDGGARVRGPVAHLAPPRQIR